MADIIGLYLTSILTLFTVSIIFKETAIYRFSQHIFQGAALGYGTVIAIKAINDIAFIPITQGNYSWLIPIALGLLLFTGFFRKYSWIARYPTAILVATGVALSLRTSIESGFLKQITSTFLNPIGPPYAGDPALFINNIMIIVIVLVVVIYFIFSGGTTIQKHPAIMQIRKLAVYLMMIAFGAGFANTIVSRLALWTGRTRYLLIPEARPILPFIILFMIIVLYGKEIREKLNM